MKRLWFQRRAPAPAAASEFGGETGNLFVYRRASLPDLRAFDDIAVVPVTEDNAMVLLGGPIWPDWAGAGPLRHNRSGVPVDRCPPLDPKVGLMKFDGEASWGGHAVGHFGHFLAEHSTRILQTVSQRPDLPMLFGTPPGVQPTALPKFFWQTLAWFGVDSKLVRWIPRPMQVRRLWVAPMAEQWAHVPPSEAYLDLLDQNTARQGLTGRGSEVVYVARDGMEDSGEGHNAGETYLCALLQQLGVTVIRPEALSLRDQLDCYSRAALLIFAEGSAMHGRQLLGRIDQTVVILNRRPNTRVGLAALQPRVTALCYAEVTKGTAAVLWPNGNPWIVRAISIYDSARLVETFESLGVPLRDVWDEAAYLAARDRAIRKWLAIRFERKQPINHKTSRLQVSQEFASLGLDHLVAEIPAGDAE